MSDIYDVYLDILASVIESSIIVISIPVLPMPTVYASAVPILPQYPLFWVIQ